ncbi:MAG: N-acetylmuramoyl-L-alanine amidase [Sulfurospirillum sp.]|nr:N-acetylmuramoyl-L-alanine amidase [Sulfurospirillum sp.]MBL0702382.1 N-acetylmuramoyl-L-alanine amidase [Sulfurospirillum sp.]
MAKITKLIFFIFLICSPLMGATDYTKELLLYDKKILTSNSDELLRVHHALKSIYIRSIVNNDMILKKETLKRLVKTSNILRLDSSGYTKELATMQKKNKQKTPTIKKEKEVQPKKKVIATVKKINKVNKDLPILKTILDKGDRLVLSFDKNITSKDVKSFKLKNKNNFREVFDIKAIILVDPQIKTPKALDSLRVAQYNDKTLRVVLQSSSIIKSKIATRGTNVDIFYNSNKNIKNNIKTEVIQEKIAKSPSLNKIIVIDAGHGGKDPGAIGNKKKFEKHAVLQISLRTGKILQKRGYKVYYTRTADKFIRLRDRTGYANKKKADLFLSIHANASKKKSFHGVETFFLSPARSQRSKDAAAKENQADIQDMNYFSKQTFLNVFNRAKIISANKLALDVQQGMLNSIKSKYGGVRDGGVREAPFWVLVGAQMPAILIEAGYISNKTERKRIFNSHYQNLLANGIADGIDSYFIKNE